MTRHPFDALSFALGLVTVAIALVGLGLALGTPSWLDLGLAAPLVLAGLGATALVTARRRESAPSTADEPALDTTGADIGGER